MSIIMKTISIITITLTICFSIIFSFTNNGLFLTLAITLGTIAYHFTIRLIIGYLYDIILNNKIDYTKRWFKVGCVEMKIYDKIRVKKWKDKMPTYEPELFDISKHSWDEILMAMCQSELVHETIIIFSLMPIVASIWFGELFVFLITSILSALFDLSFVIMQRYNRTRILKLKSKFKNNDRFSA